MRCSKFGDEVSLNLQSGQFKKHEVGDREESGTATTE